MFRLFVGIALPPEVRAALRELCSGLPGAKWVPADNQHLTLRFIGEVGRGEAEDIDHALARIHSAPFQLTVAGIGCFEKGRRVRTLWAGFDREPLLYHLQDKIESALVRAGLEPERRKFKAHITLARFRNGSSAHVGAFIEAHNRFRAGPFPVDHFTLYRSRLGREGAHYEVLAEYPLTE